jgi:hypothetical protein
LNDIELHLSTLSTCAYTQQTRNLHLTLNLYACRTHYKEYLVGLINKNNIDPVTAMTLEELKKLLLRAEIACPKLSKIETEINFRNRLIKVSGDFGFQTMIFFILKSVLLLILIIYEVSTRCFEIGTHFSFQHCLFSMYIFGLNLLFEERMSVSNFNH